jgi:20S proteasome alpha/beta subunit
MIRSLDARGNVRRYRHVLGEVYIGWMVVTVLTFVASSGRCTIVPVVAQQQQNPLTMNGGSVLAMAGKNCVVLAVDKRFGSGRSLINVRHRPIIQIPPTSIVAFTGMEGDVQSLHIELNAQIIDKYYRGLGFGERRTNKSGKDTSIASNDLSSTVSVTAVAMITSHILYRRKRAPYYVEPVIAGLKPDGWEEDVNDTVEESETCSTSLMPTTAVDRNKHDDDDRESINEPSNIQGTVSDLAATRTKLRQDRRIRYRPYLCCMDMIGAKSESEAFACAGTASKSLYGTAEALWEPNLLPDQLVSICTNAFLSALERDCLSGYGATVYLLTPDGITEYDISARSD